MGRLVCWWSCRPGLAVGQRPVDPGSSRATGRPTTVIRAGAWWTTPRLGVLTELNCATPRSRPSQVPNARCWAMPVLGPVAATRSDQAARSGSEINFRGGPDLGPAASRAMLRGVASDLNTIRLRSGLVKPKPQDLVVRSTGTPLHRVPVDNQAPDRGQPRRGCGEVTAGRGQAVDGGSAMTPAAGLFPAAVRSFQSRP